jgi:hypothetical protein
LLSLLKTPFALGCKLLFTKRKALFDIGRSFCWLMQGSLTLCDF